MPLSARNMIAIVVTIAILLGVFFTASLYYPTTKRARRIAKNLAMLEAQVEAASPASGQAEEEVAIVDAMDRDIDFFKKRNLSPRKGIPELLEQINRMGNQMNIRFVAVKPLDEKETPEYRQYPFLIETRAAYPELVNFVHRIENGLRLSLSDLRIEIDKNEPSMHRLQFTLNILELKDDLSPGQGESGEKRISQPPDLGLVAVHRDPFSVKKRTQVAQLPKKPKPRKAATKKRRRPKLVLMGIMDIAGSRFAIIDNKILRPGEVIRGQKIDQIADDHVIIGEGGRTYSVYLEGARPPERHEVKR